MTLGSIITLVLTSILAAQSPGRAVDFKNATVTEKKAILNALAAGRTQLDPADLSELLGYGLEDQNEEIQRHALMAVAGRVTPFRGTGSSASQVQSDERKALQGLRPRLKALLTFPSEQLRLAAILAIGNMDLEISGQEFVLTAEASRDFVDVYATDPSARIRQEILKTFALVRTEGDVPSIRAIVISALDETNVPSVQYALMAVARLHLLVVLPKVADRLAHDDRRVRMAAAQSLASMGQPSRAYLSQLQRASEIEQDDVTRKTMLGAIRTLTTGQQ